MRIEKGDVTLDQFPGDTDATLGSQKGLATSGEAAWHGNFRDLAASIMRLATLADAGRISTALVDAELGRLRWLWQRDGASPPAGGGEVQLDALLTEEVRGSLDLFDRLQLEAVVRVCRTCGSRSEAGRRLFDHSRLQRSVVNDADRLRKYLQRFGLAWSDVAAR